MLFRLFACSVFGLLTIGGTTGAATAAPTQPRPPEPVVVAVNPDRPHVLRQTTLARGQSLVVALGSNRSTGYRWQISRIPSHLRETCASSYIPNRPARPGSAGIDVFNFRATMPGEANLRMVYKRPWEPQGTNAYTFTLNVKVDR